MGRHREWRKLVKKLRRKRKRTKIAIARTELEKTEQEKLQLSPTYIKMIEEQEILEQCCLEEEERQAKEREQQWLKIEEEAQKQWRELQEKLARLKDERLKEEERILQEWKQEQQKIFAEKERREKLKLENDNKLATLNRKIDEYINNGGELPEELNISVETNPNKETCPFFHKTSACRFKDVCSRNHIRPGVSQILLFPNFYSHISLQQTKESEYGADATLEYDDNEMYNHFSEFFYDVLPELEKCGKVVQFKVCKNIEPHLRGNVYVEYSAVREALKAYKIFQGRWYGGKQLNVEFCNISSWKTAICGLAFYNKCPKGNACNFLHTFVNPANMFHKADKDLHRIIKNNDFNFNQSDYDDRNWRWSESPERRINEKENYRRKSRNHNSKRHIDHSRKRKNKLKSKSRSRSRTPSRKKKKRKRRSPSK